MGRCSLISEFRCFGHLFLDSVIAEIAKASDRSVIEIGRRKLAVAFSCCSLVSELALIHFDSDALVGIAEWHSLMCAAVYLLYC